MRLITVAIHTFEKAQSIRALLESEGIQVTFQNVNLEHPSVSSGVRIRIAESDLPLALRIIENPEIFSGTHQSQSEADKKIHRVLVPTDFSEHSFKAAEVAIRLAASHKLELMFLNSYIDPHVTSNVQLSDRLTYEIADSDVVSQLLDEATAKMELFIKRLKNEMKAGALPVVKYSYCIVEGVPEDAIVEYAKEQPPFLVVMGTREAAQKERDMIGSVTAQVLDACQFSVLAIPGIELGHANSSPKNILFFSNLDQEDILAMDTLHRVFPKADAKVTIVHMPSRNLFSDRTAGKSAVALSEHCKKQFPNYAFEVVSVSPKTAVEELNRLQTEDKFDLIAIPNRRKNAFSRLFNPGLANKILFQADVPMLVIPV